MLSLLVMVKGYTGTYTHIHTHIGTYTHKHLHDFGENLLVNALIGGHGGKDIVEGESPALVAVCT